MIVKWLYKYILEINTRKYYDANNISVKSSECKDGKFVLGLAENS